ncbi:arginase [Niastella koreensis]|uniref:Arginase/agmatinase/formiminoglutamase n=2 Tax=Niastella koreensis TaxID=354356 RepID=G8T9I8_NIAKG|nr:arginase family protein [Niastella koreensis]AEV99178.1 Arginase/agmatinase/formiminoglutamase [Niastella koreensis GR20-10]OQP44080.1 arginase [Niastella koreensis]
MTGHKINLFEFPTNLGLIKTDYAIEPGVKKLPDWLKQFGFHDQVNPDKVVRLEPPAYTMLVDKASQVRNADSIVAYAKEQAALLYNEINDDSFQLILGGDCSILIGSAVALRQKGKYGIFYLDGHTDFIWPEMSGTHGAAGMDLAIVAGHGHEKLTNINNLKPYIQEEHIYCVGNREYDANYEKPVIDSNVAYYPLNRLRGNGLQNTVQQFLQTVKQQNLDGFFIHFDVDALDDQVMPAVDSRTPDGLSYDELAEILAPLLSSRKAVGMEITILDPDLDEDGRYTKEFSDKIVKLINGAK